MTSKNSFWVSIKENNKRRIWLWLLSALAYVLAFPTLIAMTLSRTKTSEAYLIETLGETLGSETLHNHMVNRMLECLGINNPVLIVVASILAVVSAIQGFSFLYNKRKIDFYMGMPVKRSRRFLVIWLNGVLVYLIPSLIGTMLGWVIAAGNGVMTAAVLKESVLAIVLLLCLYFGVYHLTILAVMLTGNIIITCLGTAVLFLYELAVRALLVCYMERFFKHFAVQYDSMEPLLSPFAIYAKYAEKHIDGLGNGFLTAFYLLTFAAVIGIVAYVCYLKRPAEAAGKAMAFKLPQPFIKILITVPVTLFSGIIVSDVVGYSPLWGEGSVGFVIFTMVIVLIITGCLIQVLYEFDIRGIFHKKHHILISAAMTVIIFLIFRYDVFGYDTYLPKVEKVSSAAVVTPYIYSYYGADNYFDEEGLDYVSKYDYFMENMYLTDVGAVNKLVKKSIDAVNQYKTLDMLYGKEDANWFTVEVVYRMGSKRTVSRQIYVDVNDPETLELLDRIQGSDEYVSGAYISEADHLDRLLANEAIKTTAFYGTNIFQQKLTGTEASELLSCYKEDIKENRYSQMRESIPTGSLRIGFEKRKENYSSYRETEIRIYPFYTRCVEYLKAKGYYMESFLNPEDVEKIQVTNYNYESAQQTSEDMAYASEAEAIDTSEYIRYAVYDKEKDIEELCDKLYPSDWIYTGWSMAAESATDYSVTVYFKPGKGKDGAGVENFCFLTGEIPGFVQEDTMYVQ